MRGGFDFNWFGILGSSAGTRKIFEFKRLVVGTGECRRERRAGKNRRDEESDGGHGVRESIAAGIERDCSCRVTHSRSMIKGTLSSAKIAMDLFF